MSKPNKDKVSDLTYWQDFCIFRVFTLPLLLSTLASWLQLSYPSWPLMLCQTMKPKRHLLIAICFTPLSEHNISSYNYFMLSLWPFEVLVKQRWFWESHETLGNETCLSNPGPARVVSIDKVNQPSHVVVLPCCYEKGMGPELGLVLTERRKCQAFPSHPVRNIT